MKEIGGYIELDTYTGKMLHEDAVKLNCGRNALEYLILAKGIKKLLMPWFMCISFNKVLERNNVKVRKYDVGLDLKPIDVSREEDEWLLLVNYYGQLSNDYIKSFGKHVIVDSSMSYYQKPVEGMDTLFSCRKYFGVTDGAILYTDKFIDDLEQDVSYDRMNFLLGRFEAGPQPFYKEYDTNNRQFSSHPVRTMSKLTYNLLHGIDYELVENRRTSNFEFLREEFDNINKLNLIIPPGPFMFPLYLENGADIRPKLIEKKIFVPTLWRTVFDFCDESSTAYELSKNILPIPIDQRYTIDDMKYIADEIKKYL